MLAVEVLRNIILIMIAPFQFLFDMFPFIVKPVTTLLVVSAGYHCWRALK